MPSYVNRGVKMFDKGDGHSVTHKRSEGRLKRYESCQDLRAWCDKDEERRRYLLELMAQSSSGGGSCATGKYVPVPVLIELLQAMKDSEIAALRKQIEELEKELAAFRKLKMTDEQQAQHSGNMSGAKNGKEDLDEAGPSAKKAKESTTVLYKRPDDGHSSGAESDSDCQEIRRLLAERDAQVKALTKALDAKNEELSMKDKVMKAAQAKVDNISGKVDDNSALRAQLEKTKEELNALRIQYDELKRKASGCDEILAERDALRMRVKDYENMDDEMEKLRYRAKEADVLRMERDRLKERVDELATIETAYMKLLQETADYEQLAAERELYKHKYEEAAAADNDAAAAADDGDMKGIMQERDYLLRELNELRCTVADQEDEIQRLLIMVEKLSAGNNNKEERMVKGLSSMRLEMDKQCDRILELEAQLADLPALEEELRRLRDQLKNSIVGVAQDKDSLRQEADEYMAQLAALQRENDSLRNQIETLRAASVGGSDLQDQLLHERNLRAQAEQALRDSLDKLERLAAERDKAMSMMAQKQSGSKELLDHSENKYLKEKEARDLLQGVLDVTQDELENEKATRRKLEARIKELEGLLANTSKSSDTNRKLSLDMSNELEQLRAQLAVEKQKNIDAGKSDCADLLAAAAKEKAQMDKLIKSLEAQVRSGVEMEDCAANCAAQLEKFKQKIGQVQAENQQLQSSASSSDELDALRRKNAALEAENRQLQKSLAGAGSSDELDALRRKNAALEAENRQLQKSLAGAGSSDELDALRRKVAALEAEISQLQKSLAGAGSSDELDALRRKVAALEAENRQLQKSLAGAGSSDELDALRRKVAALEAENSQLQKSLAGAGSSDELDALRRKVAALEAENRQLQKSLAGAGSSDELDALRRKVAALEAENSQLQKSLAGAGSSDELDALRRKVAALEAENSQLQKSLAGAGSSDELDALRRKVAALEAENSQLQKSLAGAGSSDELDALRRKVAALEAEISQLQKSLAGAGSSDELDALRRKVAALEAENSQLQKSLAGAGSSDELDALRRKVAALEAENSQMQKSLAGAGSSDELDALRRKVAALEAENRQLQKSLAGAGSSDELDALRRKVAALEAENRQLQKSLAGAGSSDELDALRRKVAALEAENRQLQKSLAGAGSSDELDALRRKVAALEAENRQQQKSLAGAGSSAELDALRRKVAALEAENRQQQKSLAGAGSSAELDALRRKVAALEAENRQQQKSLAGAGSSAELDALRRKVAALEAENRQLQKSYADLKNDSGNKDLLNEIERLKNKLAKQQQDCKAEIDRLSREKKDLTEKAVKLSKSFEERLANMTKTSLLKIQQSVEKFKGSLSADDHAQNLKDTEDQFEARLAKLKEDYELRLANMMEQNKRNSDQYSSNLASLKEIYERDMKALNERHNESVLRLQNLHEQEIREINDNFEKELANVENSHGGSLTEVMKQSRDSIKNLKAAHEGDMDKLKKSYEEKIKKLLDDCNAEKERLAKKLDEDIKASKDNKEDKPVKAMEPVTPREMQDALEKGEIKEETKLKYEAMLKVMDPVTPRETQEALERGEKTAETKLKYEAMLKVMDPVIPRETQDALERGESKEETKLKYEAMLNRLTESNLQKMKLLKERYEQMLEDERQKNAKGSPNLQQMKTDVHEMSPGGPLSLMGGTSAEMLIAILNKILAQGMDSLTFDELSFLHECVCAASAKMIMASPDLKLATMSPELHGLDKKQLCCRVSVLEKEITRRDRETQRKVCCLEKCIMTERRKIDEIRQSLNTEQRRCVELGSQHDMLKKETMNCAGRARNALRELETEREKLRTLLCEINRLKAANKHLQALLDAERQRSSVCRDNNFDAPEVPIAAMMSFKGAGQPQREMAAVCAMRPERLVPASVPPGQQEPTRQWPASPRSGKGNVSYKEPLVQELGQQQASTSNQCPHSIPVPAAARKPCLAPCATGGQRPQGRPGTGGLGLRVPHPTTLQPHTDQAGTFRTCKPACPGAAPYTELQPMSQRDTFMNACSARLASKKNKRGSQ